MKKLFFFKSSATSNGTSNLKNSDNSSGEGIQTGRKSRSKKTAYEDQIQNQSQSQSQIQGGPFLRKSRSYSSGTVHDSAILRTQSDSPCSSSNVSHKHSASGSSRLALTPEKHSRTKWFQDHISDSAAQKTEKLPFPVADNASSESSSYSSNKVLDRYIDGEQHQEKNSRHINSNKNSQLQNNGLKKPPRLTGGGLTQKPRSHSFCDLNRESKLYMSTRDWVENSVGHESPRKLAKQVIERLSQSRLFPRVDSNEFDHDIPITIEDVYGGSHHCLPRDRPVKEPFGSDDCNRVLDYEELLKAELDSRTRKLENEKNELQLALEKELDRRSTEWSMKLEKYQMEEHRLRERIRELAEQNVSLQREVSVFGEKELDNQSKVTHSGQKVNELTLKMEEIVEENEKLQKNVLELQDRYREAEENRILFKRNFEAKDKECKELNRAVTRLLRTSNEQDKTIEGLRETFNKDARNFDQNQKSKMQAEHLRLAGVEQSLRNEVESFRIEVNSLRHQNINLLNRLKGNSKGNGYSLFNLDQELSTRIHTLQNQGMCLINDSMQLCSKLVENIKENALQNGLDSQFIMESDMKLQGFKRGIESLSRSLQTVSDVLHEKAYTGTPDNQCSEDVVKSDLKAEELITRLLREKLYSKEGDVERLEAELATAVRGNDVLRCEVQNAMDNLSCVTHKMKELEMQLIKKDERIYRLQNNYQDCRKELNNVNGILPKVTDERNMLWDEVKQYSENNMLLNSEVEMLKKKIEVLDEDVLLKEGQITILKDAIGKPFDLLSSPLHSEGFLLR